LECLNSVKKLFGGGGTFSFLSAVFCNLSNLSKAFANPPVSLDADELSVAPSVEQYLAVLLVVIEVVRMRAGENLDAQRIIV